MFLDSGRILVLDGAMGSMIQALRPTEGDFNSEALNLEAPWVIRSIHELYIKAGADIITTNSFGANRLVQKAHGRQDDAPAMAKAAAQLARQAADAAGRKVLVAGSMGPTGKSLTMASDASDPAFREVGFDEMAGAYLEQARALMEGGADFILLETCFDALNAKAALYALRQLGGNVPAVVSATVSDRSGRTLTGQTLEAFYRSVAHYPALEAFGLNCALGAAEMEPLIREVASFSAHPVIFYPNAGIPDELGRYADSPAEMAAIVGKLARGGLLNIAGGCCGTTPEHIGAIADAVRGIPPRPAKEPCKSLVVSGLEAVHIDRSRNFTNIGERTNVAGSRKFARLVSEGSWDQALQIAAAQVEGGATVIDINMDDPMLDSAEAMRTFLRHISGEPAIAKAAVMIDSSRWETVLEGLKNTQGRCIVNSISLKEGEEEFVRKAREINALGAAMVVMAFDVEGQAETYSRKIEICERSYRLLSAAGIPPQDIIFDVNVLSIGTGIPEHARFGVDFIEAVRWIKANLPGALTSGGISNLSFAFRGNNAVREAMHSAFLYHAIRAGLDMAIVNPQMLRVYDSIDSALLKAVEDVIFDSDPLATQRLTDIAAEAAGRQQKGEEAGSPCDSGPSDPAERLSLALVKGRKETLEADALACLETLGSAVAVIEGPLISGMEKVGELFAAGKMFLPQVVKSAAVMRDAVAVLQPYFKAGEDAAERPRAVIATVKGDVHDIGKNITATVLRCSGFEVTDLGVMVPAEEILERAAGLKADIIGVSGLITPSLQRMEELCAEMAARGLETPLFVGGAAASALHTAVKLAPIYPNVHYGADASATAVMAKKCIQDPSAFRKAEDEAHERLRRLHESKAAGKAKGPDPGELCHEELVGEDIWHTGRELLPYVDWAMFYAVCGLKGGQDEALKKEALEGIDGLKVRSAMKYLPCRREGGDIVSDGVLRLPVHGGLDAFFPESGPASPLGMFAATVSGPKVEGLPAHALRVSLAEAAATALRERAESQLPEGFRLIAPCPGYACCPDHSLKRDILAQLPADLGITLTESCAMIPEESVCGFIVASEKAAYWQPGPFSAEELDDYARRRGFSAEEKALFLGHLYDK